MRCEIARVRDFNGFDKGKGKGEFNGPEKGKGDGKDFGKDWGYGGSLKAS